MSRNYKYQPINVSQLSSGNRKRLARNQSAYFQKYGKAAPSYLVQGQMNTMVRSQPNTRQLYQKNSELKGVDFQIDSNPVINTTSTNAQIYVVNVVQAGNGSWNRVGKKIRMKSLRIKAILEWSNISSLTLLQNTFRMIVVYDKQPSSGAVPTYDTIFGGTDQNGVEACTLLSNLRYDNTERFTVLKDDVITSKYTTAQSANTTQYQENYDCFIKLKGLVTVFSGQSAPMTIADISSGALYVIVRAEQNSGVASCVVQNSVVRLRYYDN